jgi:hypothetical protein
MIQRPPSARAAALIAACSLLAPPLAAGAEELVALPATMSAYERAALAEALAEVKGRVDPAPEGKIVERVDVLPRDVIEDRDPLPGFLNVFHTRSRERVIRQQILLAPGDRYQQALVDESARSLRALRQLSLVLLVPLEGTAPDRVRLVVVTKDVWSLRLNSDFRFAGGKLERLFLQPSEENFFGLHHSASALFSVDPATYSLGGRYEMPRIAGSWLYGRLSANVIVNRESGGPEGSFGSFVYGLPLYSTRAEWAYSASVAWRHEITRRFIGGELAQYDALVTAEDDRLPFAFHSDEVAGAYTLTRSFGRGIKHDFTASAEARRSSFSTLDVEGRDRRAVLEFEREEVPHRDTRVGPGLEYHTFSTRYLRVHDLETLGLEEDFRLGHDAYVKVYPIFRALTSTHDLLGVYASGAYSVPLRDGIARVLAESTTELEGGRVLDGSIQVGVRVVTPSTPVGRLVYDATALSRYENHLNRKSSLGGDTRLRGYATQQFLGKDLVAQTLELRTRAVELWSLQIGGAAFFESGDVFDGFDDLELKQSAGFGLRGLLPMFNRIVFRADWGFPLTQKFAPPGAFPGDIVISFKQAFPMPVVPFRQTDPY